MNVLEEHITSIIRVKRISKLGTLAVTSNCKLLTDSFHPDGAGDTFLRNAGSYMSHTV
jgi:hypothetical protein